MGKIIILETTDILGLKMRKILMQNGFNDVEIVKKYGFYNSKTNSMFIDADFIIVDLDNQHVDSVKLIETLKGKKETSKIPAIFMSGSADLKKLKRVIAAGGTDFLLKPFETETLINKVYKVYKKSPSVLSQTKTYETCEIFDENAMLVVWTDDYKIGVEQIDFEHKSIIENYNKLCKLILEEQGLAYYQEMLDFLNNYVNSHFGHEEQLQIDLKFINYEEHKKIHEEFKKKVQDLVEKYKETEVNKCDVISISLLIKDWLIHHILIEDQKIKDFTGGIKDGI